MATPTELARDAISKADALRTEFDVFRRDIERLDPGQLRERLRVLEENAVRLAKRADDADKFHTQLAVLEDRVNELKKWKDEAEKRQWQFVYIFAGAMASLLVTVIVQLVLAWVKK